MSCSDPDLLNWGKVRVTVPEGVNVPMCFCGDLCKLVRCKVLGDYYGMRFFMCDNYEYDPPKIYSSVRAKVITNHSSVFSTPFFPKYSNLLGAQSPPHLCDFMQWLDTQQSAEDKAHVEEEAASARARWQRMMHEEQREEKRKKDQEDIRRRMEDIDRKEAEAREADRERKRERARRAKEAGPEAIRKGKYPRCTQ